MAGHPQRRLVVHIGMPKAGSTSIQRMLTEFAPQLRERGIDVPVNANGQVDPLLRRILPQQAATRGARHYLARPETWRAVAAQLRRSQAPQFVISEEGLLSRAPPESAAMVRDLAGACDVGIHVIAYLRPQCQYFEARYAQWVQDGVQSLPFQGFVAASLAVRRIERHPWLNYRRVLAPWRAAFGDRLTVVPLERTRLPHGLLAHFLDFLHTGNLDAGGLEFHNARPGAKAVEAQRRIGAALRMRGRNPGLKRRKRWREIPKLFRSDTPFAGFSADEAQALMACFEASNTALAREYGIDPDGILFREPVIDDRARPNVAAWHDLDDDEQAAVRAFARRTLGVDPTPWVRRRVVRRAAPPAGTTRRGQQLRLGSARWVLRWLLDPRLPCWRMVLSRCLRRRFIVP